MVHGLDRNIIFIDHDLWPIMLNYFYLFYKWNDKRDVLMLSTSHGGPVSKQFMSRQ